MTTEEISDWVVLPVKRHINLGDYHNAETQMRVQCECTVEKQLEALREVREGLNIWELEERENFLKMQQLMEEQEEAFQEQQKMERDLEDATFRTELLAFIKENPGATLDSLVITFEKSQRVISDHIWKLKENGLIKNQECRQSFIYDEDEEEIQEDF